MSSSKAFVALLALPLFASAQNCNGNIIQGYCCDGSIAKPNPEGASTPDNLICCVGDSSNVIQLGSGAPASCTAGNAVPFTQLSTISQGSDQVITGGLTGNGGGQTAVVGNGDGNGQTVEVRGGSTTLLVISGSTIMGASSAASTTASSGPSSQASGASQSAEATAASASASSTAGATMVTGGPVMQAAIGIGALAAIAL
jgi:hypothetical protein